MVHKVIVELQVCELFLRIIVHTSLYNFVDISGTGISLLAFYSHQGQYFICPYIILGITDCYNDCFEIVIEQDWYFRNLYLLLYFTQSSF